MPDNASEYQFKFKVRAETPESRLSRRATRKASTSLEEWLIAERQFETAVRVWGGLLPYPVEIELRRDRRGRVEVAGLRIGGGSEPVSVTATSLRQVGAGIAALLRGIAEREFPGPGWEEFYGPALKSTAAVYGGVTVRPGPHGHSPEFFRQVAEGYVAALAEDPRQPYTVLALHLFKSESQTRRLVNRAWELFPELRPGAE